MPRALFKCPLFRGLPVSPQPAFCHSYIHPTDLLSLFCPPTEATAAPFSSPLCPQCPQESLAEGLSLQQRRPEEVARMDGASPRPPALIDTTCGSLGPRPSAPRPPSSTCTQQEAGHQGSARPPEWLLRGTDAGERRLGGGPLSQAPFLPRPARTQG